MDMEAALRARLIADAAVTALCASRVYWVTRPQTDLLPAITLQKISGARAECYDGVESLQGPRVQMDIWAANYASCRALTEAALGAITPPADSNGIRFARIFVDGERDLGEQTSTTFIHRRSLDLIVWHRPL